MGLPGHSPTALRVLLLLPLAFLSTPVSARGEEKPRTEDPETVLFVTKGDLGFQYHGVFYPAGMQVEEFVRLFGEPEARIRETFWRYDTRRVAVSVVGYLPDPTRKIVQGITAVVRDVRQDNDPPAKHIVTDSGIDYRSTPADVEKAHGKPTRIKDREDGRKSLNYESSSFEEGARAVSFHFKGETLEDVSVRFIGPDGGPRPRAIAIADAAKAGDPDRILVVTKGNPGFQYRGLFYPAGMEASEFAFWFGESETGRIDSRWPYDKRRLLVSVEGDDVLAISFTVRHPQRPKDPPASHIVTDSGIDYRSTPKDVEKAHGKPTQVKDRGDGRTSLYYDSRTDAGGVRSVVFRFNGEALEGIFVGYHPGKGAKPQATTVPTVTTKPTR